MNTTPQQIALLQHTLGLRIDRRKPYRNYFVAGPGHHDMPDLEALEASGLMCRGRTPTFCHQGDIVFLTTDAGRALALQELPPPPAKRNQCEQFLDADCGATFTEWLCRGRVPTYKSEHPFRSGTRYRMSRGNAWDDWHVTGEWAPTKKAAKASYKEALRRFNAQ